MSKNIDSPESVETLSNQFYYAEQSNGSINIKSSELKRDTIISKIKERLSVDASSDIPQSQTIATIESSGKAIKSLPDGSVIFISDLNDHKSGKKISKFNLSDKTISTVYETTGDYYIDDFIINPNSTKIATWEISKSSKGKLLGGKSRVIEVQISNAIAKEAIKPQELEGNMSKDDTTLAQYFVDSKVCLQHPIFYDGKDNLYVDTFCPNTIEGTGWNAGIYLMAGENTTMTKYEKLKIGSYSYRPSISSDGKFAGIVRPREALKATLEASWHAQENPDELFHLNLQTLEEEKLFASEDQKIILQPIISKNGRYIGITTQNTKTAEIKNIIIDSSTKSKIESGSSSNLQPSCFTDKDYLVFVHYSEDPSSGISFLGNAPNAFMASEVEYVNPKTGKIESKTDFPDNDPPNGEVVQSLNEKSQTIDKNVDTVSAEQAEGQKQQQIIAWLPDESEIETEKKLDIFQTEFSENDCTDNCRTKPLDPTRTYELPDGSLLTLSNETKKIGVDPETGFDITTPSEWMKWKWEHSKEMTLKQCEDWIKSIGGFNRFYESKKYPGVWKMTYENAQYFNCFDSPLYLYPEIKSRISIRTDNKIFNTLPATQENGWDVIADPNGLIKHQSGEYNSIKYEYQSESIQSPNTGIVVSSDNLSNALKKYADNLKLNKREKDEFVMFFTKKLNYLGPYIQISHYSIENSAKIIDLKIDPEPDTFIPIVMYFKPLATLIPLNKPNFSDIPERVGFTALDWSGIIDR